jgi:hypothetical protein
MTNVACNNNLILGLSFFFKSEQVVIMKYPHPSNVDGRTYKDKNKVCYRYTSKEVSCDENEGALKQYPLQ